jgi:hypothetical protein
MCAALIMVNAGRDPDLGRTDQVSPTINTRSHDVATEWGNKEKVFEGHTDRYRLNRNRSSRVELATAGSRAHVPDGAGKIVSVCAGSVGMIWELGFMGISHNTESFRCTQKGGSSPTDI